MNTESEGPLDLWKSAPTPPAVPAAPVDRQPLTAHPVPPSARPAPPPMPVAEPRNLYPAPQHPTAPHYAQPVAGPQYPPPYPPQPAVYPLMNVVQNNAGYGAPIVQRAFPHGLHLVLSLVTCGLWLPVWLIHYLVAGHR